MHGSRAAASWSTNPLLAAASRLRVLATDPCLSLSCTSFPFGHAHPARGSHQEGAELGIFSRTL